MSAITVAPSNHTRAGKTCRAAMGFSFAAGTTDGARCQYGCLEDGPPRLGDSWPKMRVNAVLSTFLAIILFKCTCNIIYAQPERDQRILLAPAYPHIFMTGTVSCVVAE